MNKFLAFFILILFSCQKEKPNAKYPLSPELEKALADFEIMDGFQIELVAAEPLISDPVAMEIDEDGNWYVAEMPGYPLDLSKTGKIKKLIDTNGDGLPDKSEIFADSLTLPMGLMKWKNGILVSDSPNIFYLEDSDGDHKADKKIAMLTGFSLSNPQHNMNTPKFGVDNWIYVGHSGAINSFAYENVFGDKGSDVRFPDNENAPKLENNADGRNVRFKPDSYELENLSGETQYGHTTDLYGHRFYTDNANHLFHEVIDERYVKANPNLAIADAMEKIPDHGDACEVFPITENPNHQLLTDVGVVTSSCGVTWYDGGAFGPEWENRTLIGEPVHNLVHIDNVEAYGATFTAKRVLENKEFLASKDPWFRPVNFYVGPDGALYVIDYYRQIVEHPEWMSDEVNQSGALYEGTSKGRIYRITPKSGLPMNWLQHLDLSKKTTEEWVELLDHSNAWYRRTVQRLLFQKGDKSVSKLLVQKIKTDNQLSVIPSLWLLFDWKTITPEVLETALNSKDAGVRENALQITDRIWHTLNAEKQAFLSKALINLAEDENPRVRFQWLCSSSYFDFPEASALKSAILNKDFEDKWVGTAAIAASAKKETELLDNTIKDLGGDFSEGKVQFFKQLGATLVKGNTPGLIPKILSYSSKYDWCKTALLDGLAQIKQYYPSIIELNSSDISQLYDQFISINDSPLRKSIIKILATEKNPYQAGKVKEIHQMMDKINEANFTGDALALLSKVKDPGIEKKVFSMVLNPQNEEYQTLALKALPQSISKKEMESIHAVYSEMSAESKKVWIKYLTNKKEYIPSLLHQVEDEKILVADLEWPQIVHLMNYYDTDIRNYAREVFAINEDRKAVLQNYLPAAEKIGNAQNGRKIFEANCSICHQINGKDGKVFGPDLATLKSRNKHSIITEIINPNNSIADKYGQWQIVIKDESQFTGLITHESDQSINLRLAAGNEMEIAKSNIKSRIALKTSAMPNGFENNINVQEMADLLALIKGEN